jgi:hypothetical protein
MAPVALANQDAIGSLVSFGQASQLITALSAVNLGVSVIGHGVTIYQLGVLKNAVKDLQETQSVGAGSR